MSYFVLTKANTKYRNFISFRAADDPLSAPSKISGSLDFYLTKLKTQIHTYGDSWDEIKKITNPYEFIHTKHPIYKQSVCRYRPLSRSYFKMMEIFDVFPYLLPANYQRPIASFHLAEGPGGFIEALVNLRKRRGGGGGGKDTYIGMTLSDSNDVGVPGWRKTQDFLRQHSNVKLEYGQDGTGNLLCIENLMHCREKYGGCHDLVTADGGFDFSVDFNHQEENMIPLLFAETCYALFLQRQHGSFILKLFECTLPATVDILILLSSFYEKVAIFKPNSSRYANSERYLVCTGFLPAKMDEYQKPLICAFREMLGQYHQKTSSPSNYEGWRFLSRNPSTILLKRIEECNAIFGQQQLENILTTVNFMEYSGYLSEEETSVQTQTLIRQNIQKCIQWCQQHNITCDYKFSSSSFSSSSSSSSSFSTFSSMPSSLIKEADDDFFHDSDADDNHFGSGWGNRNLNQNHHGIFSLKKSYAGLSGGGAGSSGGSSSCSGSISNRKVGRAATIRVSSGISYADICSAGTSVK
jgi:23S rRNA U2552 (ribose-2'-O)-methylase RlmE/FtsJ